MDVVYEQKFFKRKYLSIVKYAIVSEIFTITSFIEETGFTSLLYNTISSLIQTHLLLCTVYSFVFYIVNNDIFDLQI